MSSLRAQRTGWYFYDWANSAFATTVVTVFLGPYLTSVARSAADADGLIRPLGIAMNPGSWFPLVVSVSVVLQVLVLPVIGAISDNSNRKRTLLGTLAFIGSLATTALYFITTRDGNYQLGGVLFIAANVCFGASMVVYNAFLPEISSSAERDKVSSRGWALGYLGGGLLLFLNLKMYGATADAGGDEELIVRMILASAGIWWILFTVVPMALLRSRRVTLQRPPRFRDAFTQLLATLKHARGYPQTFLFLLAYLIYNDAVQTVITMSSQFGQEELNLGLDVLMTAILMVQFVAIAGSLLFERVAALVTTKIAIQISLVGWTIVLVLAYTWVATEFHFYVLAGIIAIVLGGTQALSRSLFSQMIPAGKEAEYFALYEISDKGTSWLGPLFFGLALTFTGSYRIAILSLVVFFIVGFIVLTFVNVKRAVQEAGALNA